MNTQQLSQSTARAISACDELSRMPALMAGASSGRLLEFAIRQAFTKRIAVISSFAAESVVLLHQVSLVDPETPILFLNTGKLFGETLRYRQIALRSIPMVPCGAAIPTHAATFARLCR
jgi:3'-phosphoadenosine 5'-phosphosulfate sulfotransferase (PAPS reductase)/FAD synthetase